MYSTMCGVFLKKLVEVKWIMLTFKSVWSSVFNSSFYFFLILIFICVWNLIILFVYYHGNVSIGAFVFCVYSYLMFKLIGNYLYHFWFVGLDHAVYQGSRHVWWLFQLLVSDVFKINYWKVKNWHLLWSSDPPAH